MLHSVTAFPPSSPPVVEQAVMTFALPHQPGVDPRVQANLVEFVSLRRDIHQHPELAFKETRTADLIARRLAAWGYEVTMGVGGTGVVGRLTRGSSQRALALRADFDALPIHEVGSHDHKSTHQGRMHACGHDGHTSILLAAARAIAETGAFDGTLNLIFQPAEEIGAGARRMIDDGLFTRFPVDAIFGLHNWPGLTAGKFAFVPGPAMAAVDKVLIRVIGRGGHGAAPHETIDPITTSAHMVTALQTIVSRNVDPIDSAVVTIASIHGGDAGNVIPEHVDLVLTVRSFRPDVRALLEQRIVALVSAQAASLGAKAEIDFRHGFPAVINHSRETAFARSVALETFGADQIVDDYRPRTASEDFAYFLEARPGSFIFIGNGEGSPLHSPTYDFNDTVIGPAATFWLRLTEQFLSLT
jgi:hippurate hydrolase